MLDIICFFIKTILALLDQSIFIDVYKDIDIQLIEILTVLQGFANLPLISGASKAPAVIHSP